MQGDSIKGLMDSHYIAVKLDNNLFNDKYFYYCYDRDCGKMGYDGLGKELHGATMDGINSKLLKKLRLPVPPIQEQQEISTYLDQKCTLYGSLSNLYQAKANKLKELKKSMIYEYVTGKKPLAKTSGFSYVKPTDKGLLCKYPENKYNIKQRGRI